MRSVIRTRSHMKIAGIRFRDNWKIYDFDASDVEIAVGDSVIVDSDRGQGFARVVRLRESSEPLVLEPPEEKKKQPPREEEEEEIEIDIDEADAEAAPVEKKAPKGYRHVLRKATEEDLKKEEKNRDREAEAFTTCQNMIAERELPMKLIRVEYSFDASRATFYFFSENRVDFRELVKDLAHKLRTRIEMRQIGVRDVARLIGGYGPCGRELCCTTFLRGFEPVSIRMAKKQEMVLNPAKISGVCGRLLCCLSYEYGIYDEIKRDVSDMKAAERSRKEEEESRARAKREEEERRLRDEERGRQEKKRAEQKETRPPDKRKDQQEKKTRPPQDQRERQQQKPEAQQQGEQQPQGGDKSGKRKRRRFWRKKKKQQGGGPQQEPGGPPAQGG